MAPDPYASPGASPAPAAHPALAGLDLAQDLAPNPSSPVTRPPRPVLRPFPTAAADTAPAPSPAPSPAPKAGRSPALERLIGVASRAATLAGVSAALLVAYDSGTVHGHEEAWAQQAAREQLLREAPPTPEQEAQWHPRLSASVAAAGALRTADRVVGVVDDGAVDRLVARWSEGDPPAWAARALALAAMTTPPRRVTSADPTADTSGADAPPVALPVASPAPGR